MNFYTGSTMPPSPIGNVAMAQGPLPSVSIGNGHTQQFPYPAQGGYYGYCNPWEIQKQRDLFFQQQAKQINSSIDFEKAVLNNACRELGIRISEKELEARFADRRPQYSNSAEYYRQQRELQEQQALQNAVQMAIYPHETRMDRYFNYIDEAAEEMGKRYEGKSLNEQYETLNEIAFDQEIEKARRSNRNLRSGYSGNDYRSLIRQSAGNQSFRPVFGTNIDDYEVSLPSSIEAGYANKRAKFLDHILGFGARI